MKKYILYTALVALSFVMFSCEIDNVDAPNVSFHSQFVYQGKIIPQKNRSVALSFFQKSYEKNGSFDVVCNQKGELNGMMFNGTYQVVLKTNAGAYVNNTDTTEIVMNGDHSMDWPMTPYYFVNDVKYTAAAKKLKATIDISKTSDKDLEYVSLLIATRTICDNQYKEKEVKINASEIDDLSNIVIDADLTDWKKDYCYIRVGVRSTASEHYNYSEVSLVDIK